MAKSQTISISAPFDARHVAGVGVQGSTPMVPAGVQRSNTAGITPPRPPPIPEQHSKIGLLKRTNTTTVNGTATSRPVLKLKTSMARLTRSSSNMASSSATTESAHNSAHDSASTAFSTSEKHVQWSDKKLPTRPARADSGVSTSSTAIDLTRVPKEDRPLGFKEIMAVKNFSERMALYKKTRDYWAHVDHGLDEWVVKARTSRVAVRV